MVQGKAQLKGVVKLQKGAEVQLHGLEKSKELNGLVGKLLEFDQVKLRWGVQLPDGKKVALKMNNLLPISAEVAPAVEVPHLGPTPVDDPDQEAAAPDQTVAETEPEPHEASPEVAAPAAAAAAGEASNAAAAGVDGDEGAATAAATADAPPSLEEEGEWPVLPTSAETKAKIQSGCWWDGGSAAKRFTQQLHANDPALVSVCLVPPKRFNDEDCAEVCDALEANTCCQELLASGHPLSAESCQRLGQLLRTNSALQTLSVGESSLGDRAALLFEGLGANRSLTKLDLEHKGLTIESFKALAAALEARQALGPPALGSLNLSRNRALGAALAGGVALQAPEELLLCDCGLSAAHAESLGSWAARGVRSLNLRDNSSFGGDGVELFLKALLREASEPALKTLRLDGCAIGDDGLEALAEAFSRGLELEELSLERCELGLAGCEALATALRGARLRSLSVRANVIGDAGCTLLARCAERLDLSSTSLSGQVLSTLGEQDLVSLELFSNPALGPSVATWCAELDSSQWQRLEYLDLTGCGLQDAGFECVLNTLMDRPDLMPQLRDLLIGANDVKEDDDKCELVDRLGAARGGRLTTKWVNA
eukprot:TRINITY_DN64794_c0_g1_i1.p1 TRINITY_DN64794_c0_g1~~TRINITY_DN64794_c0_g1_i1.p1  ORF type:complete len:598 (-),score=170.63 TRINITY_DN64794_c0_g1_i1:66-1859(-)